MTTLDFLFQWAIRSSALILAGALLLQVLRVKDPAIRLAAWTAMLCGSLAIPVLTASLPRWNVEVSPVVAPSFEAPLQSTGTMAASVHSIPAPQPFDWTGAAETAYLVIAGGLLLRLLIGLLLARRLRRSCRATGRRIDGIEVLESTAISAPITLGLLRPAIVLPPDWPQWDAAKLEAVLAHERSHVQRMDPAVQFLSAVHRSLLWYSPLSWFLHRRIVRLAEDASDDAAVAAIEDRASYAEVLLDFMSRGLRARNWHGVAMARYGTPDQRINRILDSKTLSAGVTRASLALIVVLAVPLAYLVAAATPQAASAQSPASAQTPRSPKAAAAGQSRPTAAKSANATTEPSANRIRRYVFISGSTTNGSWDSSDPVNPESLRSRFGSRFVWFRHDRNEYVVTDDGILSELERAMEPQNKVNAMQDEVNRRQSEVNELQSQVNGKQNEVNRLQDGVNRRQDLANRIQDAANRGTKEETIKKLEALLQELRAANGGNHSQDGVNRRQSEVNAEQARVNERQHEVNMHQHKVNEEQKRVSAEYSRRFQEILESAMRRNLARKLDAR